MSKKSNTSRQAAKKKLQKNADWLEGRLENTMLDLDALSSMSIDEVNAELKTFNADPREFVKSLNEKLPAGASIPVPSAPRKKRRKPQTRKAIDRKAAAPTPNTVRGARIFTLKNAFVVSLIIIGIAVIVPLFIQDAQNNRLDPITALEDNSPKVDQPPTYIVGPAPNELVRGIKYTIEGLEQVTVKTPLPENPGDLTARFQMRITVAGSGKVIGIEPMLASSQQLEPGMVDSLLQWQFSPLKDSSRKQTDATITIEYFPE